MEEKYNKEERSKRIRGPESVRSYRTGDLIAHLSCGNSLTMKQERLMPQ